MHKMTEREINELKQRVTQGDVLWHNAGQFSKVSLVNLNWASVAQPELSEPAAQLESGAHIALRNTTCLDFVVMQLALGECPTCGTAV